MIWKESVFSSEVNYIWCPVLHGFDNELFKIYTFDLSLTDKTPLVSDEIIQQKPNIFFLTEALEQYDEVMHLTHFALSWTLFDTYLIIHILLYIYSLPFLWGVHGSIVIAALVAFAVSPVQMTAV